VHTLHKLVNKAIVVHNFFSMFIFVFYVFRVAMCPSSGEITIYATLGNCHCVWMSVWYAGCNLLTRQSSIHTE